MRRIVLDKETKHPPGSLFEEIEKLINELDKDSFEPLSQGVGLGRLKPVIKSNIETVQAKVSSERIGNNVYNPSSRRVLQGNRINSNTTKQVMPWISFQYIAHLLLGHLVDIIVVTMTLSVGLIVADYYLSSNNYSQTEFILSNLLPIKIYKEVGFWKCVLGVYGVFIIYWSFFKLFYGATFGNSLKAFAIGKKERFQQ